MIKIQVTGILLEALTLRIIFSKIIWEHRLHLIYLRVFFNNKTSRKGGSIDDMIKERYPKFTKHITSHVFRYTHISMLAERGWQLKEIMDRVGHKGSKTTLEIYQQVTKDMRKNEEEDLKKITIGSKFLEN
ncbi:tyrosine-type recombinase/integrase [Lactococcus lactis]|uniref:tyrosine-type recombinase/integrase n=1 Tax=Lactococcus lactis TaxID=1358 RepID=UPI001F5A391F|nr:tyrosine-type recombinase/integrase [Lactococcus lactis]